MELSTISCAEQVALESATGPMEVHKMVEKNQRMEWSFMWL